MNTGQVLTIPLLLSCCAAFGCKRSDPSGAAKHAQARVVAVSTARATQRDVPLLLEGLGHVTAYKTVAVRPQVDGRLERVMFTEGQQVKAGDVLARLDTRPFDIALRGAEAALARDRATLTNHELNLARQVLLRQNNLVAQQAVTDQQAITEQMRFTVMADLAQLDSAKLQRAFASVSAPIGGRTGIRLVDPGNIMHAGDANAMVVITQMDPISVIFTLPEDERLRVAQSMQTQPLDVEVRSRDGEHALGHGKLLLIDNQIDQTSATMRLKAVFDNAAGTLWPNQFVKVRLLVETLRQALAVPAAAVVRGPEATLVYVVNADDTVDVCPVILGQMAGDWAIITTGLRPGARVVVDGQAQLRAGSRVRTHPSPAASDRAP